MLSNAIIPFTILLNLSSGFSIPFTYIETTQSAITNYQLTQNAYDEGHNKLQQAFDKIAESAINLDRGDYIGFQYTTGQLYNYLLAINYKDENRFDPDYRYTHNFSSNDALFANYHEYVDFTSVELFGLKHEGIILEIELRYKNKKTGRFSTLKYLLDYGVHGIVDKSEFSL